MQVFPSCNASLNMYVCIVCVLLDAVDSGHNKKAVQLAEKILKKQDDLHCAKVSEKNVHFVSLDSTLYTDLQRCSMLMCTFNNRLKLENMPIIHCLSFCFLCFRH